MRRSTSILHSATIAALLVGVLASCSTAPSGRRDDGTDSGRVVITATDEPSSDSIASVSEQHAVRGREGRLRVLVHAKSAFDPWTKPTDASVWAQLRATYDAMVVYSPYFDRREPLFDETFVYIDLYGLKPRGDTASIVDDHPDWILRTNAGDPVYIPWGCAGADGCPQFAADVGNPAYQASFLERVGELVDVGYPGVLIDDVNLAWRLSDRNGDTTSPVNPRTGENLTLEEWRRDVADLVELVHATFPGIQVMHNAIWFADSPDFDDPDIDRQLGAADVVMLERGATDAGLTSGGGQFGFASFMAFIDRAHGLGVNVLLLDESATTEREQRFNLVAGLLVNDGGDFVSTEDYDLMAPGALWPGFATDLGAANGRRTERDGVWRRDFDAGIVVLNEPDREERVVDLDGEFVTEDGRVVSEVRLEQREAVVLTRR